MQLSCRLAGCDGPAFRLPPRWGEPPCGEAYGDVEAYVDGELSLIKAFPIRCAGFISRLEDE